MTEHFDAVVIGSGFGGSTMGCRVAEAGLRVCLLERGKPYPPGSFPRAPHGVKRNFWDPSEGLYGMFDAWSFRGIEALVASGLGGGSLIYANVLIRKDEKWFVKEDLGSGGYEYWPVTREELDPYYDPAEAMLGGQCYPLDRPPYNRTAKTWAMEAAARDLRAKGYNATWQLPLLAVTFGNRGDPDPIPGEPIREAHQNLHGRTRYTCRLCGECDVGCNYGSKNTLDYNYLSAAKRAGAELRTLCEVRTIAPRQEGGYTVRYVEHSLEREGRPFHTRSLPHVTLTADRLIVSAGTLGSTYLLLRNRENFPGLSARLGTRFCGNGDLLGFGIKCHETRDGRRAGRLLDPTFGPVITSAIRVGDAADGDGSEGRGFYIEDAGFPAFVSWLLESSDVPGLARRALRFAGTRLRMAFSKSYEADLSGEIAELFGGCNLSSDSLPLLGMGRDIPDGTMTLSPEQWLDVDWRVRGSQEFFERMRGAMRDVVGAWDGTFRDNLLWFLDRVITVHPLGGCPMGRNRDEGVVDALGEVFGFPGFYIADGSIMPGPVGANPCLTITALAERSAERIAERAERRRGPPAGMPPPAEALDPAAAGRSPTRDATTS
ncbi:MAG: GMC family oxidoreductase [Gemmatimonadota bacterium]|nr:GMC family oxidoreductase [Gemmatimonadota bacterium]